MKCRFCSLDKKCDNCFFVPRRFSLCVSARLRTLLKSVSRITRSFWAILRFFFFLSFLAFLFLFSYHWVYAILFPFFSPLLIYSFSFILSFFFAFIENFTPFFRFEERQSRLKLCLFLSDELQHQRSHQRKKKKTCALFKLNDKR